MSFLVEHRRASIQWRSILFVRARSTSAHTTVCTGVVSAAATTNPNRNRVVSYESVVVAAVAVAVAVVVVVIRYCGGS